MQPQVPTYNYPKPPNNWPPQNSINQNQQPTTDGVANQFSYMNLGATNHQNGPPMPQPPQQQQQFTHPVSPTDPYVNGNSIPSNGNLNNNGPTAPTTFNSNKPDQLNSHFPTQNDVQNLNYQQGGNFARPPTQQQPVINKSFIPNQSGLPPMPNSNQQQVAPQQQQQQPIQNFNSQQPTIGGLPPPTPQQLATNKPIVQQQNQVMPPAVSQSQPQFPPASMYPQQGQQIPQQTQQPGQPPRSMYPQQQTPGFNQQPPSNPQQFNQQQQQQQQPYMQPNQQMQNRMPPLPNQNNMRNIQSPNMPPYPNSNFNQQPQMPGQQQQPYMPPQSQPTQQRRLDPEQMPNPIQVISENQRGCGGVFQTNAPGCVPPLVTSTFLTHDQGNSGPRFIRSSMYSVPITNDMLKQSAVPFCLIVSPFAKTLDKEIPPPIVNFGELGPIRCLRCKAYMCPFMQFIDAGRRFQCLLCKATTEVPQEYFQHLDHNGQRSDKYERPELILGTYEFVATTDYCRNNKYPKPPAIVFVIDVSYNNVKSGLVNLLCSQMKEILKNLPIDVGQTRSNMKVGFITYNNTVHFYNIKNSLAQPQMMVVGDLQEMFMPLLDGFLCDVEESESVINSLMEQIPKMFGDTRETETILLPALCAGLEALKASECAGKLLVFHSSLPTAEAPGKLKLRDDRKLLATEKEKTVLTPQCTTYNMLAQDCAQAGVSVDLFIANNSYIDLPTIGQVSRLTGGEIYKYTYFQADVDGQRLITDIIQNISRPVAFDTVMRVRTSTGVRPTDFYGHFYMSNTTDMEIASIDSTKSVAIEIKHDDKLSQDENVYIQVALLYTSCGGQRRLRILNLCLKTCTQLADLFRSCDLDTLILFLAKQSLFKLLENSPKPIKDGLINRAAQILACYRKNCASPTSAGQLILPECMKLLPLYISCLLKNDAFSGGSDLTIDDRSYTIYFVMSLDLPTSVQYFYPRLIPIHDVDPNDVNVPAFIRCTSDKMLEDGAYILENGIHMFLWLGNSLSTDFTQSVFGTQCTQQIDSDRNSLPVYDNPLSKRVRSIISTIQFEKKRCMRLTIVKQRDKLENILRHFLVEDRGITDGSASYIDFLCHMHKEIRQLLS
uniref:Putative vesicle coat complex copii subunit sec24/subunit sfb2 n=1 Tax=Corethrella appendiculata TaxID=1370023 RepID=U5EY34_9DIPT